MLDAVRLTLAEINLPWDTPPVLVLAFHAGDVIRKIRDERGITIEAIARETGVDKGTISKMERGVTDWKGKTFKKVCAGLQLDPAEVLAAVPRSDPPFHTRTPTSANASSDPASRLQPNRQRLVQALVDIQAKAVEIGTELGIVESEFHRAAAEVVARDKPGARRRGRTAS